jgi:phosphoserine aminotransferase
MTTTTAPAPTKAAKSSTGRILNFSAGPAVLPEEVLKQAQQDIWNIAGSGIGIMEHSHRGPVFDRVIEEAEADCRRIANIPDEYHVLFLQGGATLQFAMVPMNFLPPPPEGVADYADTGVWTTKAIKEARLFGNVNVCFEGGKHNYDHIPADSELTLSPRAAYFHYCSNNTIYGTEYRHVPAARSPIVCDASSNIFSKPLDIAKHALIYAGAQKNLGPSGVVLVIIRKDFCDKARGGLATMISYGPQAKEGSRLNTPPAFGIYIMGQVFKWILRNGGLEGMARRNADKARQIYDAIDQSGGFYRGVARPDSRSLMNITFRLPSEDLEKKFVGDAEALGMDGLKGHRSAGGIRASVYNAFPPEGCRTLAQFMKDFATRNG